MPPDHVSAGNDTHVEDCGETFETLSRLRLHECSADATDATGDTTADDRRTEESIARQQSRQRDREWRARRTTGDALDEALEQARDGDPGAAVTALAHLEREFDRVPVWSHRRQTAATDERVQYASPACTNTSA
jgi:hypothetical protein